MKIISIFKKSVENSVSAEENDKSFTIYLSQQIRCVRLECGKSQDDLANYLGVNKEVINNIENAKLLLQIPTLFLIADYLDVSIDYMLGRSNVRYISMTDSQNLMNAAEIELINNYRSLDEEARGMLLERSEILIEESI